MDAFPNEEKLSLQDFNFMMAFTIENYFSGETLDDPRYMKWVASFEVHKDGAMETYEIPVFPCREEDYANFYQFDERSKPKLEKMQTDEDKQLYCMDF